MNGADEAVEAAAEAYVWGYPLVTMHRTRATHPQLGVMGHRARLSTAADRSVVAPNNDTLYSSGFFDLRDGDLRIDVPPMEADRYWSVMLLDAYTNVSYVCHRLHGSTGTSVRVRYEPEARPEPDLALAVMPVSTPTTWVLARVLVDGPEDLEAARAAQRSIHVEQDGRTTPATPLPAPQRDFFSELRAALEVDPPAPWDVAPSERASSVLQRTTTEEVLAAGRRAGAERIRAHGIGADRTGNGWGTRLRGADFGGDALYRAAVARFSLAAHLPAENRTYTRGYDGRESATLRFGPGSEPPVNAFWSLCCYGPDTFFVANELDRYSIGDRTEGLQRDSDSGLTISLGSTRPSEVANWLPTPPGACFLALRAYEGDGSVVSAAWFPPELAPIR